MVWQKAVRPRWLLSDLLKIPTNQLCRIQSKLPRARNIALLSCSSFCELKAISISVISFAHTALCGGEFQALTFWEPLLASSFFFSVINSLNNVLSLIFGYIHVYVCIWYYHSPSWCLICSTKRGPLFSFLVLKEILFSSTTLEIPQCIYSALLFSYPNYSWWC